jgi:hypothetical protein
MSDCHTERKERSVLFGGADMKQFIQKMSRLVLVAMVLSATLSTASEAKVWGKGVIDPHTNEEEPHEYEIRQDKDGNGGSGAGFYWRPKSKGLRGDEGSFVSEYLIDDVGESLSESVTMCPAWEGDFYPKDDPEGNPEGNPKWKSGNPKDVVYPNGKGVMNKKNMVLEENAPSGHHVYKLREGDTSGTNMLVGMLVPTYVPHQLIHNTQNPNNWGGFKSGNGTNASADFFTSKAENNGNGFPGWFAYCARCGGYVNAYLYLSKDTAQKITHIPLGAKYTHIARKFLEQGTELSHRCKAYSINRYQVEFNTNNYTGVKALNYSTNVADGYYHPEPTSEWYYYNVFSPNAIYEGKSINNAKTKIEEACSVIIPGYKFAGWYGNKECTGNPITTWEQLQNLHMYDGSLKTNEAKITVYAKWVPADGTLATYDSDEKTLVSVIQTSEGIKSSAKVGYKGSVKVNNPTKANITIYYNGNGGTAAENSKTVSRTFTSWTDKTDYGAWNSRDHVYTNTYDQSFGTDKLIANYETGSVNLPSATHSQKQFLGWYTAANGGELVGKAGDIYSPKTSGNTVTLYAHWGDVAAWISPVVKNANTGEVSVKWGLNGVTSDNLPFYKAYYQEGTSVSTSSNRITNGAGSNSSFSRSISASSVNHPNEGYDEYTVENGKDGLYTFTLYGAQGGNNGGNGGKTSFQTYLAAGDSVLSVVGKQGSGTTGGGASAIYIKKKGTSNYVLYAVAGGGGASGTNAAGGMGNVSFETGKRAQTSPAFNTFGKAAAASGQSNTAYYNAAGQKIAVRTTYTGAGNGYPNGSAKEGYIKEERHEHETPAGGVAVYDKNGAFAGYHRSGGCYTNKASKDPIDAVDTIVSQWGVRSSNGGLADGDEDDYSTDWPLCSTYAATLVSGGLQRYGKIERVNKDSDIKNGHGGIELDGLPANGMFWERPVYGGPDSVVFQGALVVDVSKADKLRVYMAGIRPDYDYHSLSFYGKAVHVVNDWQSYFNQNNIWYKDNNDTNWNNYPVDWKWAREHRVRYYPGEANFYGTTVKRRGVYFGGWLCPEYTVNADWAVHIDGFQWDNANGQLSVRHYGVSSWETVHESTGNGHKLGYVDIDVSNLNTYSLFVKSNTYFYIGLVLDPDGHAVYTCANNNTTFTQTNQGSSTGGAGYIDSRVKNYSKTSGERTGDGMITYSTTLGQTKTETSATVTCPDKVAPEKPTAKVDPAEVRHDGIVTKKTVTLKVAADKGTNYTFFCQAFDAFAANPNALFKESPKSMVPVVSGIAGYKYVIDFNSTITLNNLKNGTNVSTKTTSAKIEKIALVENKDKYLHVVYYDGAGNYNDKNILDINLGHIQNPDPEHYKVLTPELTITNSTDAGIYQSGGIYYVNTDPKVVLKTKLVGKIDGTASHFRLNKLAWAENTAYPSPAGYTVYIPTANYVQSNANITGGSSVLSTVNWKTSNVVLGDKKTITVTQDFLVTKEAKVILTPYAEVDCTAHGEVFYNTGEARTVYGDGTAPVIKNGNGKTSKAVYGLTYDYFYDWTKTAIKPTFTITDNISGIASVKVYEGMGDYGNLVVNEAYATRTTSATISWAAATNRELAYTMVVTDNVGNYQTVYIMTRHDDTAPTITNNDDKTSKVIDGVTYEFLYDWTTTAFKPSFTVTDILSGIASIKVYEGKGTTGTAVVNKTYSSGTVSADISWTAPKNAETIYTMVAVDNLGNAKTVYIMTRHDDTPPALTEMKSKENVVPEVETIENIKYYTYGWTAGSITFAFNPYDILTDVASFTLYQTDSAYSHMSDLVKTSGNNQSIQYTDNTEGISYYEFVALDGTGNKSVIRIKTKIDWTSPTITGLEDFQETTENYIKGLDTGDFRDARGNIIPLVITVSVTEKQSDASIIPSGLRDFYVTITNHDNGLSNTYTSANKSKYTGTDNGGITDDNVKIDIMEDLELFNGRFSIEAYATDYVGEDGNSTIVTVGTSEMSLNVSMESIHYNEGSKVRTYTEKGMTYRAYRKGEAVWLKVTTTGYADAIRVDFPESLKGTKIYRYNDTNGDHVPDEDYNADDVIEITDYYDIVTSREINGTEDLIETNGSWTAWYQLILPLTAETNIERDGESGYQLMSGRESYEIQVVAYKSGSGVVTTPFSNGYRVEAGDHLLARKVRFSIYGSIMDDTRTTIDGQW